MSKKKRKNNKGIIYILLIIIVVLVIYIALNQNKANVENNESNNKVNQTNTEIVNTDKDDKEKIKKENENKSEEQIIEEINKEVKQIDLADKEEKIEDKVDESILGNDISDLLEVMGEENLDVQVVKYSSQKIFIIPYTDFVDNHLYYFSDDGQLIMYKSESNSIGGTVTCYFNNNKIIKIENDNNEREFNEKEEDIVKRAKNVYKRYINT